MSSTTILDLQSSRIFSTIPTPRFTTAQARGDALVSSFVDHATDGYSLAAMVGGGLVYRLGRMGTLALGSRLFNVGAGITPPLQALIRYGSIGIGFTGEVFTFEAGRRALRVGIGGDDPNLLRWSGENGLGQGTLYAALSLGALKGAGTFVQGQNLVLRHLAQDSAMVLAHNVSGAMGITPRPRESLSEQFVNAEATLWQMNAGMGLVHGLSGGAFISLERSLDLGIRARTIIPEGGREILPEASPDREAPSSMRLYSFNPAYLMVAPKLIAGLVLGRVLSTLRRGPAVALFAGLGAALLGSDYLHSAPLAEWLGDLTLLGAAGAYGWSRARSLLREARENPFQSEPDLTMLPLRPIPEGTVEKDPVELRREGTDLKILDPQLQADGFPRSFIWSIDPPKRLSLFQRGFYAVFDPVRFSMSSGRFSRSSLSRPFVPFFAWLEEIPPERFVARNGYTLIEGYRTFDEFFTRRLNTRYRKDFYLGAAPAEGRVLYMARGSLDQVLEIKGERISLRDLVGEEVVRQLPEEVGVIVTYLSPKDYHLGHSPVEGKVVHRERIPGTAWTVGPAIWNESSVEGQPGPRYLTFNARDVLAKETAQGPLVTVYVAATNVYSTEIHPQVGDRVKAGMHEQSYHFGSTNVYIFDARGFSFPHGLHPGQQLIFGETPFMIPRSEVEGRNNE